MMNRKDNETFEEEFCVKFTKACEGINPDEVREYRKKVAKENGWVEINGKKYRPVVIIIIK